MRCKVILKNIDNFVQEAPTAGRFFGLVLLWFYGVVLGVMIQGHDLFLHPHPITITAVISGLLPWQCFTSFLNLPFPSLFQKIFVAGIPLFLSASSYLLFFIKPRAKFFIIGCIVLLWLPMFRWGLFLYKHIC